MEVLYQWLQTHQPSPSDPTLQRGLLFTLSVLEELYLRHPSEEFKSLYRHAIREYARANRWIHYHKRHIAADLNLSISQLSRQMKQLQLEGKIEIKTLPMDTFIAISLTEEN